MISRSLWISPALPFPPGSPVAPSVDQIVPIDA